MNKSICIALIDSLYKIQNFTVLCVFLKKIILFLVSTSVQ